MSHPDRVLDALSSLAEDGLLADVHPTRDLIEMSDAPVRLGGRVVTAHVPFLPTTWLSPNRGERKEGRVPALISAAKAELRADTATWLVSLPQVKAITEPFGYARVSVVLWWHKRASDGLYRPEDPTNAVYSLKAFFDGLIDAGLLVDDGYQHMELGGARVDRCGSPQEEGVTVTVEEVRR